MVNQPEVMLDGQIGRRGRHEYSYIFFEAAMLLLIELKRGLHGFAHGQHSNIVAQVIAEADGRPRFHFALSNS